MIILFLLTMSLIIIITSLISMIFCTIPTVTVQCALRNAIDSQFGWNSEDGGSTPESFVVDYKFHGFS